MRALILALIFAIPLSPIQTKPPENKSEPAENAREATNPANSKVRISEAPDSETGKQSKQRVSHDGAAKPLIWTEYVNAYSTLVIAAFTLLLFVGVVVQIRTSRAIERAWIIVELAHEDRQFETTTLIGDIIDESTSIPLTFTALNGGKTPAWILEGRVGFEIFESAEAVPDNPPLERARDLSDLPPIVHTKESAIRTHMPIASGRLTATNVGVLYGVIRYRDIFKRIRTTTFGYRVQPITGGLSLRLRSLDNRPRYNISI